MKALDVQINLFRTSAPPAPLFSNSTRSLRYIHLVVVVVVAAAAAVVVVVVVVVAVVVVEAV